MTAEKSNIVEKQEKIFGEYGRKKLLMYAESFQELAGSFGEMALSEMNQKGKSGKAQQENTRSREQLLKERQALESRQVLKDNLEEMSRILEKVAEETVVCINLPERQKKKVSRMLSRERIQVEDLFYLDEHNSGRFALNVRMYSDKPGGYTVRDVADMLSVALDRRLHSSATSPYMVDGTCRNYLFVEEPPFMVLTGYARAAREQEKVSGDNYSIMELDCGKVVVLLSDGMGSGERAAEESQAVIERMETLLEAGHSEAAAINIVNNTLLAAGDPANMSTLDVCSLDLYTGKCEFRKIGAAASFIKSSVFVEPVTMNRLPLGIFFRSGDEMISRELMDNDFLIMVTDGVLDAFSAGNYEDMLCQYIRDMKECSPAEVAQRILQFALKCSGGHVKDDMTILVLEVFQGR